ncbi:hypothetical protein WJR50_03145 [Catalinimonas sp. 4WD22]
MAFIFWVINQDLQSLIAVDGLRKGSIDYKLHVAVRALEEDYNLG